MAKSRELQEKKCPLWEIKAKALPLSAVSSIFPHTLVNVYSMHAFNEYVINFSSNRSHADNESNNACCAKSSQRDFSFRNHFQDNKNWNSKNTNDLPHCSSQKTLGAMMVNLSGRSKFSGIFWANQFDIINFEEEHFLPSHSGLPP